MRSILITAALLLTQGANAETILRQFDVEPCSEIFEYKGEAYFCGRHRSLGRELFRTNGTAEGTNVVADIDAGPGSSDPRDFFILNDKLYFTAETTPTGRELWRTDGTEDGTKLIKDTVPGPVGGLETLLPQITSATNFIKAGNAVYFITSDLSADENLITSYWRTDGSFQGTVNLTSDPELNLISANSRGAYFSRFNRSIDRSSLEIIPNTGINIQLIEEFAEGCGRPFIAFERTQGVVPGEQLYLKTRCSGAEINESIIVTDGTIAGTRTLLVDGVLTPLGETDQIRTFVDFPLFGDAPGGAPIEGFTTDGATSRQFTLCEADCSGFIPENITINNRMLYRLVQPSTIRPLASFIWSSDGTTSGSQLLTQGRLITSDILGNRLFFFLDVDVRVNANETRTERQVQVSDGTSGGTRLIKAFDRSSVTVPFGLYTTSNQTIFITRQRQRVENPIIELWSTDGSPSGTRRFATIPVGTVGLSSFRPAPEGNRLYLPMGGKLWHTDGTTANTFKLRYFDEVNINGANESFLPAINNLLLDDEEPLSEL